MAFKIDIFNPVLERDPLDRLTFDLLFQNEESRALTTEQNLKILKSVKILTMGDETPKKTGSRSSEVPSSLPKPTFMPEPKSFSTKKVNFLIL